MVGFPSVLVLIVLCASGVVGQSFFGKSVGNITIDPLPTFETCTPANISWSGGRGEYRRLCFPATDEYEEC